MKHLIIYNPGAGKNLEGADAFKEQIKSNPDVRHNYQGSVC